MLAVFILNDIETNQSRQGCSMRMSCALQLHIELAVDSLFARATLFELIYYLRLLF